MASRKIMFLQTRSWFCLMYFFSNMWSASSQFGFWSFKSTRAHALCPRPRGLLWPWPWFCARSFSWSWSQFACECAAAYSAFLAAKAVSTSFSVLEAAFLRMLFVAKKLTCFTACSINCCQSLYTNQFFSLLILDKDKSVRIAAYIILNWGTTHAVLCSIMQELTSQQGAPIRHISIEMRRYDICKLHSLIK